MQMIQTKKNKVKNKHFCWKYKNYLDEQAKVAIGIFPQPDQIFDSSVELQIIVKRKFN